MKKLFNIAGPCLPGEHYLLPALERETGIKSLIENKQYFVMHAARQTGKTTMLNSLEHELNGSGNYYAMYCSLESVQPFTEPVDGVREIYHNLKRALSMSILPGQSDLIKHIDKTEISTCISDSITSIAKSVDKPLVLLFDEADCLSNGTLITFLRQLRDGFINRTRAPFAHSVALVGMRDIRDYKSKIREGRETLGSASPFNVITESLTIGNFSLDEVENLYLQHQQETGQPMERKAIERAYYWTSGQPWLVNALAREAVQKILNEDYTKPVTEELIDQAAENIMKRRDTHIDSLLERLKEERVRNTLQPVLLGSLKYSVIDDDAQYCIDLGLIKDEKGELLPSNPIYREVIVRTLSYDSQHQMTNVVQNTWRTQDGGLDMDGLLKGFQEFWRENSDIWIEKYQYKEAAPHLILQAFLQRVINGGGTIDREYATGRRRIDLCVHFHGQKFPIEIKLHYGEKTLPDGHVLLGQYMESLGCDKGWLVIFNRDEALPWEEKIYWQDRKVKGKHISVVGC